MADDMTRKEYWDEIRSIRENLLDEYRDEKPDEEAGDWVYERLWQTVDGHQWIIYNSYNLDVLRFTDNEDAYMENFGEWPPGSDLTQIHTLAAYEAMRTDVMDGVDIRDFEGQDEDEDD